MYPSIEFNNAPLDSYREGNNNSAYRLSQDAARNSGKFLQRAPEVLNSPVANPEESARSRLVAEFIADSARSRRGLDPNVVTIDRNVEKNLNKKDEKLSPEEKQKVQADTFKKNALEALSNLHKNLVFSKVQGSKPIEEFEPNDSYQPKAYQTPAQIAVEKLGMSAANAQLQLYTDQILALNGLSADKADKPLGTMGKMRLPGISADGAVVCKEITSTTKYWLDGSKLQESIYGTGQAEYKDAQGFKVTAKWNPDDSQETSELKENANTRSRRNAKGEVSEETRKVEKTKDDKGKETEKETWETTRTISHDDQNRRVVKLFGPGNELKTINVEDEKCKISVNKVGDNEYVGTRRSLDDEILDDNYRLNLSDGKMVFYSRKQLGEGTEDTFEDGNAVERRNKDGKLTYEKFTDDWGRSVEKIYSDPPRDLADKILVTTGDNKTIEFKQADFGDFWGKAKFKPEDGPEFEASVHRLGSGMLVYNKGNTQSWSELKDGTRLHKSKIMQDFQDENIGPWLKEKLIGGQKSVQIKDGEKLTQYYDQTGSRAKDVYEPGKDSPVTKIVRTFEEDGTTFSGITVTLKSGEEIKLAYDRKTAMFRDIDTKNSSEKLSKAYYFNNKLFLTAENSNEYREIESPAKLSNPLGGRQQEGKYDHQLGIIITPQKDGGIKTQTLSPGREDIIKDGKISGKTIAGERSTVDPGKETVVYDRGGSKLQFNPQENKISYWGPRGEPTGSDSLSKDEREYYNSHIDLQKDPRDFAEIHRAYVGRESEMKALYQAIDGFEKDLAKAVSDKRLTEGEASALRKDILHDIAHPEDIDQQQMGTCNVEVVRREMAMNNAARYVSTFANAINGKVVIADRADLADGAYANARPLSQLTKTVPVDLNLLKSPDSTGRNIAARMFDNLAISATVYPDMTWRPTPDGIGLYTPVDKGQDLDSFRGMEMGQIATCLSRLSGVKRTVINVDDVKQLSTALDANGGRSMIIAVEGNANPVTAPAPMTGSFTNHVITLVKVDEKSNSAWFMNNWGLEHDHSTPGKPASATELMDNMVSVTKVSETSHKQDRETPWTTPAMVIGPGEPGKVYHVTKEGALEEDPRFTLGDTGREILK